jgi:PTS system nitrogen regulatory IIA component
MKGDAMNFLLAMSRSLRLHPMRERPSTRALAKAPLPPRARKLPALQPQLFELDVDVPDVKRTLERAAEVICRAHDLDPAPVFRALWRREQIGSTAIGHGVALPHARIPGIAGPLMLFMRPRYAIDFAAPDGRLVTRIWVILVPADGSADDHLDLLAAVAEACSDEGLRAQLDAAPTADEAARALRDWTQRHAA